MKIKNNILSVAIASCALWINPDSATWQNFYNQMFHNQRIENTKEQVFVCLETDSPETFTHTKVLESIQDDNNTVLEYPINQITNKKYNWKSHPLAVSGISKTFWSLIWVNNVAEHLSTRPQKLVKREEEITSTTRYQTWDTLRFSLKDPLLEGKFPDKLDEQLKERWFENMNNPDSLEIKQNNQNDIFKYQSYRFQPKELVQQHVYDIVVKKIENWESALAVYRNWKLFMSSFVSVWLPWHQTITWQFNVIAKQPYKRSKKYDNSPMSFGLMFDYGWFYLHQWKVTWKPASHWCVRLPWVYADILYSLVKDKDYIDIYI